jgi:hypothetical protein
MKSTLSENTGPSTGFKGESPLHYLPIATQSLSIAGVISEQAAQLIRGALL